MIVVDEPSNSGNETEIRSEVAVRPAGSAGTVHKSLAQRLASVIGKAEGLPADWSENHDTYLREQHQA